MALLRDRSPHFKETKLKGKIGFVLKSYLLRACRMVNNVLKSIPKYRFNNNTLTRSLFSLTVDFYLKRPKVH